jgi:hypothetical protein
VRIATHDGYCSARLGRVFVVDIASRVTANTHRDEPMTAAEEATEVWSGGAYVAALIERGCPGGVLATTHVTGTPVRATPYEVTGRELAQAELAFAGSAAARQASVSRVGTGSDSGGTIITRGFALSDSHTLTFVSEFLSDMWHCSGAQTVFPMLLEQRAGAMRVVRVPRMDFEIPAGSVIVDIDGDGTVEMVFEYEGSVSLYELRAGVSQLTLVGGFGVNYNIGC